MFGLRRVLVIDDDPNPQILGGRESGNPEYVLTHLAELGAWPKFIGKEVGFSAVVIDPCVLDGRGREIAQAVRRENRPAAIIFLVRREEKATQLTVKAKLAGEADDYIVKPFPEREFVFTLRKALKFRGLVLEYLP